MSAIQCSFRRYEKKYLLTYRQYRQILSGMQAYMQPDAYSRYTICNLYYDTDDYRLIRTSLEKPVYKEKLRVRSYGVPGRDDDVFVELKKKYDGEVYKRRVVMPQAEAMANLRAGRSGRSEQIGREIDFFLKSHDVKPKVFIAYEREAYQGRENPELRITFDTNLRYREQELELRAGDHGSLLLGRDTILMEIKIPGAAPVWLARLLSEARAYSTTFSKYGSYYKNYVLAAKGAVTFRKEVLHCA